MINRTTGTKEWARTNVNIAYGCPNNCRYCYAAYNALRFGRIATRGDWSNMTINQKAVDKNYQFRGGTIMFPTSHDIVPDNLDPCVIVLHKLLTAGNSVLIVTKPNLGCVVRLCKELKPYRDRIMFRFTIGALDDSILGFWEPGAPCFLERHMSLIHAFNAGYKTSISCEPYLDRHTIPLFRLLESWITDSFWIGRANQPGQRIDRENWPLSALHMYDELLRICTDDWIRELYGRLANEPKIRWKDSCRTVIESLTD